MREADLHDTTCLPSFSSSSSASKGGVSGSSLRISRFLPLGVLGGVGSPLGGRAGGTPLLASGASTVPASSAGSTGSAREAGSGAGGVPVTGGGLEARLDGGRGLLLSGGLLLLSGLVLSLGFGVTVEVKIGHDVPGSLARVDGAAEAQDLAGEQPPDGADGVATLVVGGDGDVNVLGGGVGVAEGNDGDVDVRGLLDGLGVGAGVRHDDEARLLERASDVVGEATGGEATSNGRGTGVGGKFEDSALAVGTGRDDANVGRVVDADNDAGGEDNLLPGLADVEDIDTIDTGLPQVGLHVHLQVLATQVRLGSQEHLNVLAGGVENGRQVVGSHLDGFLVVSGWRGWERRKVVRVLGKVSRQCKAASPQPTKNQFYLICVREP